MITKGGGHVVNKNGRHRGTAKKALNTMRQTKVRADSEVFEFCYSPYATRRDKHGSIIGVRPLTNGTKPSGIWWTESPK